MDEAWRPMFSVLVPFVSMFGGPLMNLWVYPGASRFVCYAVSVLIGMVVGGFGSEYTAYPMHLDAGIEAGTTMGLAGQKLLTMQRPEGNPHA